MKKLIVIFNHTLTPAQQEAAQSELGVDYIVDLPPELADLWGQVPTDIDGLAGYLAPLVAWLDGNCDQDDYLLIQGEFGATFFLVSHALSLGLQPIYSTTRREASETHGTGGTVELRHSFRHVRFRRYQSGGR